MWDIEAGQPIQPSAFSYKKNAILLLLICVLAGTIAGALLESKGDIKHTSSKESTGTISDSNQVEIGSTISPGDSSDPLLLDDDSSFPWNSNIIADDLEETKVIEYGG